MPRETAQQRREREAAEEAVRAREREDFRVVAPALVAELRTRLNSLSIDHTLDIDARGRPSLIVHHQHDNEWITNDKLTCDSEPWEFDQMREQIESIDSSRKAAIERFELAKSTFKSLSPEQQRALKEFINRIF